MGPLRRGQAARSAGGARNAVSLDGNGHLVIETKKEDGKYLDACIATQGKFEHSFGFYVARIQLQKQQGHWPGFWICGPGVEKVGSQGRDGCEIDVMEKPALDDRRSNTTCTGTAMARTTRRKARWSACPASWMASIPSPLVEAGRYVFYVDGKETWRTQAGRVCQVPQFILLSDEIGSWAGNIAKAKLPDRFVVDYVRVYDLVEISDDLQESGVDHVPLITAVIFSSVPPPAALPPPRSPSPARRPPAASWAPTIESASPWRASTAAGGNTSSTSAA